MRYDEIQDRASKCLPFQKGRRNMPDVKVLSRSRCILLSTAVALSWGSMAHAQTVIDPSTWFSTGPEGDKQRQQELKKPGDTREYKPLQIGNWLVESGATLGAVYDTNLYSSRYNAKSANGVSVSPTVTGRLTDGVQNTTFYLQGDARRYTNADDITTLGGRVGIGNSVEIQRGTIWKALLQAGRAQDDAGSYNATGSGDGNSGIFVKPINSNSLFAATSLLSRVDYNQLSGFWSAGVSASLIRFEDASLSDGTTIDQSTRDTNSYTVTGRLGWNIAPVAYAFLEPSATWQQTPNLTNGDTTNYRLTAGLGTDRINLMRGELFAGYARQMFNDLTDDAKNAFVYGGRLSWFPLKELTLNLSADDSIGVTAADNAGTAQVYTSHTKSIATNLSYQFDRTILASLRAAFSNVEYKESGRKDDIVRAGADVDYMITGNLGIRLSYANVNVDSSSDLNSVQRDIYTIGVTGRF